MGRSVNPNRAKALEIYLSCGGDITTKVIAEKLGANENTVRKWKMKDCWKEQLPKRQKGGQPHNRNASKPHNKENKHGEKHGLYSKIMPKDAGDIIDAAMTKNAAELLWDSIMVCYVSIMRAQEKASKFTGKEYCNYVQALTSAQGSLARQIEKYDEMIHKNWDLVTEEQKARIDVLKAKVGADSYVPDDGFLEALQGKVSETWQE